MYDKKREPNSTSKRKEFDDVLLKYVLYL